MFTGLHTTGIASLLQKQSLTRSNKDPIVLGPGLLCIRVWCGFFTPTLYQIPLLRVQSHARSTIELELELIQTQMTQKPVLRAEIGMRVRCANTASAE